MLPAFRALVTRCRVLTETFSNPIGSRIVNRLRTFSAYYAVKATTRTRVLRLISVVMASHSQQGDVADNRLVICKCTVLISSFSVLDDFVASIPPLYPPHPHNTHPHTHTHTHSHTHSLTWSFAYCTVHATDIHLAYNNVQRLKEWIKQKNQR